MFLPTPLRLFTAACALGITCLFAGAQSITYTAPSGYVTIDIAPGSGATRALTVLSIPLLAPAPDIDGATNERITGVTAITLSASSAGWTADELSTSGVPKAIRITSGSAEGRTFLISTSAANAADTVTLDSVDLSGADLTTLGIVADPSTGDTFQIIDCETLPSMFGTPAEGFVVGNDDPDLADNALLFVNGSWSTYYYHVTNDRWTRRAFLDPDASAQPIKPETGVIFNRLGTQAFSLTVFGDVTTSRRSDAVNNSGLSFLGSNWPVAGSLLDSGIKDIPGWVANSDVTLADTVLMFVNGSWSTYWWNGTNWRRRAFLSPISDDVMIEGGGGFILSKLNPTAQDEILVLALPYNLDN